MHIRAINKDTDKNFIIHSFMKSFVIPRLADVERAPAVCRLERSVLISYWHAWIEVMVDRGEFAIACSDDDELHIVGYAVKSDNVLRFVYVKNIVRNNGIAKTAISSLGLDPKTCKTTFVTHSFSRAFRSADH